MPEITETDLLKTGPGTLAGRYLRNFWQLIYLSAPISKKAKPSRFASWASASTPPIAVYRAKPF